MEYNTQKRPLIIPEYGRNVHTMIDFMKTIEDPKDRRKFADMIVDVMSNINPQSKTEEDYRHKLWDQLFIMADFDLDVDAPYPKPNPEEIFKKPEKLPYRQELRRSRYYGRLIQDMIDVVKDWEEGDKKEAAALAIANQMKRNYVHWNKDHVDDPIILKDLKKMSEGKLQVPEGTVLIKHIEPIEKNTSSNKSKRKRKKKSKY